MIFSLVKKPLRIAVSGKSGCGNTTVSTLLSKKLGITLINFTFRSIAQETGKSLEEIIRLAKEDSSYDKEVDTRQVQMAMETSCVLGSRLAIWMLKEADLKVYLRVDDKTRAERIFQREGGSIESVIEFTRMRDQQDSMRYKNLYGIDNNDYSFADIIIDAAQPPDVILSIIISELVKKNLISVCSESSSGL